MVIFYNEKSCNSHSVFHLTFKRGAKLFCASVYKFLKTSHSFIKKTKIIIILVF